MGLFLMEEAVERESQAQLASCLVELIVLASDPVPCELEHLLVSAENRVLQLVLSLDDFPKPQIITQPETTMAVVGKDIRFTCSAASSSSSPMTFAWKKDNEVLTNADMENFAHVRAQDGEVMEYTTILHLRHVTFGHEGRYQCIITNHFGSTYSHKARLIVNGKKMASRVSQAQSPTNYTIDCSFCHWYRDTSCCGCISLYHSLGLSQTKFNKLNHS